MKSKLSSSKRAFLKLLLTLPVIQLLRHVPGVDADDRSDDIVEVDGWILKRKDLS